MSTAASPGVSGSKRWIPAGPLVLAIGLGVFAGVGSYTFSYAKGLSYLSTDPKACVNCHIMQTQYDGWQMSGHHHVAVCVDCHLPHEFIPKYLAKSENGWRHGKLFTTGGFVEPIEIKPAGRQILQENCVRCHATMTSVMLGTGVGHDNGTAPCTHCHATVGHGERAALGGPLTPAELNGLGGAGAAVQHSSPADPGGSSRH